jgi:hypothetical protein
MAQTQSITVTIGTDVILSVPCDVRDVTRRIEYEYYMKRGNKHYFRSPHEKMCIVHDGKIEGLKRGDKVTAEWK